MSLNVQTKVLSLLNHIYQLDSGVTKYLLHEFSSAWDRLQMLVSCHSNNSLVMSLALVTLAIVIHHGPQSDISQLVLCCSQYYFL